MTLEVGLPVELPSEIDAAPAVVDADGWCEADLLTFRVEPSIFPIGIVPRLASSMCGYG